MSTSMDPYRESTEKRKSEVVLVISGELEKDQVYTRDPKFESFEEVPSQKPTPQSPEIVLRASSSVAKPPRPPRSETLIRRKSFAKPKSRFAEPAVSSVLSHSQVQDPLSSSYIGSPRSSGTPKTQKDDDEEEEEEEDEEIFKKEHSGDIPARRRRFKVRNLVEWLILILALSFLVTSLLVDKLQSKVLWGLEIWKWCLMVAVVCCGRLVSNWIITMLVFLIEKNFIFKKKVLYFVYGLKKSAQVFLWSFLVCLSWFVVFNRGVPRSDKTEKVLLIVSRLLISLVLGSVIWLLKTLLIKILASSFHMNRFFDRIQESIFHQYILQMLSGLPVMEYAEKVGAARNSGQLSFRTQGKGKGKGEKHEVIDVSKLYKVSQEKVSAWTMKGLVNVISTSGLSTLSNTIDETFVEEERRDKEINSEWDAKIAAYKIFKNVARPGCKYIDSEDLLRFLSKEEVEYVMPLLEGASDTGKIKKSALKNWVVKSYLDRKSLAHSLNDTKTAVNQLHKLATVVVIVSILIITLILTGIATTKVLVFVSSQLLLVGFMFGNTCKMAFEALIFVFVMHPFDVGDRCVVDGIQMIVEEMNILTTVFLKYNNEKIYYPNSVLSTKPISNFYRSPDMSDSIEFSIAISTSVESIAALKAKIKMYIDNKPNHWHSNHSMVVKDIEDVNKMNMGLFVNHTMNYQNMGEKTSRRSDLVLELKRILEELSIRYNLLPQDIHLSYNGSTPLPMAITQTMGI